MYYYAYIDSNNIVTGVYALPTQFEMAGYIAITEQQYTDSNAGNENSIIGKVYNAETGEFNSLYYYAILGSNGICTEVITSYEEIIDPAYIQLDSADTSVIGKYWNGTAFINPPFSVFVAHSSENIRYKEENKSLSEKLDEMDALDHAHSNKTVLDGITAEKVAAWDNGTGGSGTGTAGADGEDGATFTPSVSAEGVLSWTNDKDLTNPTPVNIKGSDGLTPHIGANGNWFIGTTDTGVSAQGSSSAEITAAQILEKLKTVDGQNSGLDADLLDGHNTDYFATATQLAGKADAEHTHTGFATENHTHTGFATTEHTHTGYAAEGHTHDSYASATHTHEGFASADHTHDSYASADHAHDGYATADHSHDNYIDATTYANGMNGKANTDHTHTPASIGAAAASHTHDYAASNHTHSGYASSTHTHSSYASSSHTHTPASIGASASGHSHTTNGSCEFTGTIRTRDIVPGSTDTYNIGGYSNRYKYIYSINQLQVSSDARVKKDIKELSADDLFAFVNALNVVGYKYKNDKDNKERIGLIAQEVVRANPEIASYFVRKEEDGMLALSVADLVFPLIAAVQNLTKEVEDLKKA